jgi:2-polyprenyl-6-hydroxyphenyl methylase / 3-demethylubiquinone-9 3-methyltransferase
MPVAPSTSVIREDVKRFGALGDAWWDAEGPMAPLHRMNPVRIGWASELIATHFRPEPRVGAPLAGVEVLDIGCGAGLFAEPLARLGAEVLGIDPAEGAIDVARRHAEETGAKPVYRVAAVEQLVVEPRRFEVVSAMEVIEHVADPTRFVAAAASLVKPGGLFLASTLNRTFRSFALAIVGAEYVLRWLAPGTHRWEQFVTPIELTAAARVTGLRRIDLRGVVYDPLKGQWRLSSDTSVNYFFAARKPEASADADQTSAC